MNIQFKELYEALLPVVGLALVGGLVRVARFGTASWRHLGGSLLGSAFAGVIVHWFLAESGFSEQVVSAIVASSGYLGGTLLDALQARLMRLVEVWPDSRGGRG